jgi:molybdate transport system substrate-binding protein
MRFLDRLTGIPSLLTTVLTSLLIALPAGAADVTVFAAASLKESLDAVTRKFEDATGHKVVASYAASSALAKQIENGAPADLFISADLDWADYLDQRNLLATHTRINLLKNELVLIAPASSRATLTLAPGLDLAAALGKERLAIANPDAVPAGKYGKAALIALGAWSGVEHKLARAENVRGALLLVSRGETPLGIVYKTDALADKGVKVISTFPANTYPAIIYPAAVTAVSKTPVTAELLKFMTAAGVRAVWAQYGFSPAP